MGDDSNRRSEFLVWIERLCGQEPEIFDYIKGKDISFPDGGLGLSQLNEILLAMNLDRMDEGLFEFIFGGDQVKDYNSFKECIRQFRIKSIIVFGNFKFGFKHLRDKSLSFIENEFAEIAPRTEAHFKKRHDPIVEIQKIAPEDTYLLGYLVDAELMRQLQEKKISESEYDKLTTMRDETRKIGSKNNSAYMDSDHLDVYVATSMRERVDFWNVATFVDQVFNQTSLKTLKLRHFDPTQAYCPSRIDKGILEGLMLKRAKCTIYMGGESDTLGKDSELATTLAQGKPVIAYVPSFQSYDQFRRGYVDLILDKVYKDEDPRDVAMRFLEVYYPKGAWQDKKIRDWLDNPPELDEIIKEIFDRATKLYDSRAKALKELHPLGIQINLHTGVANGVLVARNAGECARLLRGVMLNSLKFNIEHSDGCVELKEDESESVYRIVTEDDHLTNSFWNFYLRSK